MRLYSWTLAALLVVTLGGALPARAAEDEIVTIDISKDEPAALLAPEEVDSISQLQRNLSAAVILSPVSPDDAVALAVVGQSLGFLNIQDASFTPLNVEQFNKAFPLALLGLGEFIWTDDNTLVSVGSAPAKGDGPPALVLAIIDRSGDVGAVPLSLGSDVLPISLSPDATKILLLISNSPNEQPQGASVPITWPQVSSLPGFTLPAALQRTADRLKRQMPGLAAPPVLLANTDYHTLQLSEMTSRIAVYDVSSGEAADLLTLPFGSVIAGIAWKPNATSVALSLLSLTTEESAKRGNFDGALISEQIYKDVTGNLPPAENPFLQNNTVEVFDMLGGPRQTLRAADGDGSLLLAREWSPDSETLLVQAVQPSKLQGRRYPVYTIQFAAGVSYRFYNSALQETGRLEAPELSGPTPVFGGVSTLFVGNDELIISGLVGSNLHPFYYNRRSGELRNIADRAGAYARIVATHKSRQIAFLYTSFTSPPDLYRLNWDGSALARLSWANAELEQLSQTRQDPISFKLADGSIRTGTLIQPAGAAFPPKNVPIVAWQEGGPGVPMYNQWAANVENPYALLPNFGTALLVVSLAGRSGYGADVYNKLYDGSNYGQRDVDELAEIMQQAIGRGWTSRGKVGITGCSYGGYFTWQSIIRHPDLYAAANPQCALVDAVTEWSRGFPTLMPYIQGASPFAKPEEYRRDSPIYNADKVKAAVLSFHGSDDFLPVTQNENMHLQLLQQGTTARMVKFLGAGHGLGQPEWQRYAAQEQILWFREHLR